MTFSTLSLNENFITTLVSLFEEKLPAAVTAINETITDAYKLDPAEQFLDYMPGKSILGGGMPAVCVQDMPTRFVDDLQFSMEGQHGIGVASVLYNADFRALAWQLRRYNQVIAHVIQGDREAGIASRLKVEGGAWVVEFAGTEPGPMLADRDPNAELVGYLSWTWFLLGFTRSELV